MPKKRIQIKAIDNGFYLVPDNLVKSLCIDGELPEYGYEKRAHPAKILNQKIERIWWNYRLGGKWEAVGPISEQAQCWIKRTRLSWHDGKRIDRPFVWALHVWTPV